MGEILDFFTGSFSGYFFAAVFLIAIFAYINKKRDFLSAKREKFYNFLILISIGFRIAFAGLLTILQYYSWRQSDFTKAFINLPDGQSAIFNYKYGYFLHYSLTHFWSGAILSIAAALLFYFLLVILKKHNERFFEEGELELGLLTALICGWPDFLIFIPLVFISVTLFSVFRRIFFKNAYTTLGWPLMFAALITLIFGENLLIFSNLLF